jgi:hypothetical protein
MSFEMKYDVNGLPLKTNVEPVAPVEVIESPEPVVETQTEIEPEVVETPPNDVVEEVPVAVAKPAPQESWKAIRDKMAAQDKRTKELELALKEAQSRPKEVELPEEDLSLDLDEDALAEGKHLRKVDKRFQKMQKELDQYKQQAQQAQQQSAQQALQAKLKTQYPDWDSVYNEENIARLQVQEPEIYEALNASTDIYKAGISAYKMIKQMGISDPVDVYAADKALAQKNASKPKSLASISPQQGDSPLSKANAFANGTLTDDLKKNLWKEMNEARR